MAEKEYIDRDMYYQKINDFSKGGCGDYHLYRLAIDDCINVLDEMPAADVAPVRHGHWINENFYTHCSACGKMAIYDKYGQEFESNFCPNCGAKMDGGD